MEREKLAKRPRYMYVCSSSNRCPAVLQAVRVVMPRFGKIRTIPDLKVLCIGQILVPTVTAFKEK